MKAIIASLVLLASGSAYGSNHDTITRYFYERSHIIVVDYAGCSGASGWVVGGYTKSDQPVWAWKLAADKREMEAMINAVFRQDVWLYVKAAVDSKWCDMKDKLMRDASI